MYYLNTVRQTFQDCTKITYSIKEYPTSLAAWEKNATMMTLTWPMRAVMASAPYRNGMLESVPTVTVIPVHLLQLTTMLKTVWGKWGVQIRK